MNITGKIYDKKNLETLPSANVYMSDKDGNLTGHRVTTYSDMDGNYKLKIPMVSTFGVWLPASPYVTASFVGYGKKTLTLSNRSKYDFPLNSGKMLDEVVVTAEPIAKPVAETKNNKKTVIIASVAVLGLVLIGTLIYNQLDNGT